eukprot:TRINITY_DN1964_c0_g2_i5.p2 TRINITY_DN1964_c0_g2~~TRINITY_DN1964_c0_g2_i5.p2  ORF type:complete len:169 (-),score=1.54 TRINITY_DN1964_c0_g2_i5:513-1019(-)
MESFGMRKMIELLEEEFWQITDGAFKLSFTSRRATCACSLQLRRELTPVGAGVPRRLGALELGRALVVRRVAGRAPPFFCACMLRVNNLKIGERDFHFLHLNSFQAGHLDDLLLPLRPEDTKIPAELVGGSPLGNLSPSGLPTRACRLPPTTLPSPSHSGRARTRRAR